MYREAIRLEPELAQAHANLGMVLCEQGDHEAGLGFLRRAIELDPALSEAHNAMGIVLASRGDAERGIAAMRRAVELRPDASEIHSNLIMTLGLDAGTGLAEHLAERRRWQRQHVDRLRLAAPRHGNSPDPTRCIRIGYVSADFRQHSAAYAFGPMLLDYDRQAFQVTCYSNSREEDAVTARFRSGVDRWRNICDMADADAARLVREDGIDILVDLSGHTVGNRLLLFARKPAPVQVTAWGGVTGTGLDAMDYILADDVLIPQRMRGYFTEEVVCLPSTLTYLPQGELPPLAPLPAGQRGFVTFGYFNNYIKLSRQALALWARLLACVPTSRLLLKAREFDRAPPRERVLETFTAAGVAADRLSFLGRTSWYEHLAAQGGVDIALDPFPNVGGASTLEALAMGTPVVTLLGETPANRISASSLTAAGLGDWVAETEDEYLAIARARARDVPRLERLRTGLRQRLFATPLGNPREYVRAVESAYRTLWRRWCDSRKAPSCNGP